MHGAVSPLHVMMRRLFTLSQGKTEHISAFATRLETALNNIQRDHPGQLTQVTIQSSLRNRFYQGLKKTYKESLHYLYAAKAPYEEILTAARVVEAEQEDYNTEQFQCKAEIRLSKYAKPNLISNLIKQLC